MPRTRRTAWWFLGAGTVVLTVVLALFLWGDGKHTSEAADHPPTASAATPTDSAVRVETVHPSAGGLARRTSQPGSAHSYESAELFAKVSGYLEMQHVDIGTHVKKGDLLAEIYVPELTTDIKAADALRQQAKAEVAQSEAQVESAAADHQAALARVAQSEAEVERWRAELVFAQKQYERIRELSDKKGIEARIVDEKQRQVQSARAGQQAAESAVKAAVQQAAAAESRVALAKADLQVSQAKVRVAESAHDRAKVIASYTKILSPYDGVITVRNFHRGAYVRSPDQGGQVPLLSVDRVDLMRVVVRIPEREIPYVHKGDQAVIEFDALPNRRFTGEIARIANGEESLTRTMRAEIDLPNPEGVIRDHMYGRVDIALEEAPAGVTVPSTCLVGNVAEGTARLFVVEDGVALLKEVQVGKDTGIEVEVFSGIDAGSAVITRPPGGLADGAAVIAKSIETLAANPPKTKPESKSGGQTSR